MPSQIAKNVNGPLGEAYSAYWDHWLAILAKVAKTRFSSYEPLQKLTSPMEVFEQVADKFGAGEIFHLAHFMPQNSGFEVIKHVLEQARNPTDLAQRWQTISQQQASVRFGNKVSSIQLVSQVSRNEFLLDPGSQRQAKLTLFGAAMLGGAAASAFQHVAQSELDLIEIRPYGASRSVYCESRKKADFGTDSKLLIRLAGTSLTDRKRNTQSNATLNHLSEAQYIPFLRKLSKIMISGEGTHISMSKAAHTIGLSKRTMSRRLGAAGLSYAKLMRFLRLRHASQLLALPDLSIDEIAFQTNYADRHHMSRDFRQMTELSPSAYRKLLD